jgi:hypothetical protein
MLNSLRRLAGAALMCVFVSAQAALAPAPLYLDVPVSDVGTDNSLLASNTSRKLAVAPDGTIYALFRSPTNGIRIAKSTDRGQTFSPSSQISATNAEAEIAIAADGDLHVVWATGGSIVHTLSQDGSATFSTPVTVGSGTSAHMAVDGDRVYIIPRAGNTVYHSDDDGATFAATSTGSSYAYADIFVDPLTRDVLVVVDNPSVYFFVSTDFAQTFAGPTATGKSVFYSVGALSVTGGTRYLFLAGSSTNLERIEVANTPAYFTATVAATAGNTTRSLSADVFGNVVSGYLESGTNNLKFEHSNDLAASFGAATTVVTSATRANAAINTINGDILFLYEKANQIYSSTYERALVGYDITVSPSLLNFAATEVGTHSSLPVTLTNVTGSAVAVNSLSASGDFSQSDNCGGTIAASSSCTVTVTFSPVATGAASGVLSMNLGGFARQLSLSGFATPARPQSSVQLDASAPELVVGDNLTLTAQVTGSSVTGTVDFTENGSAIANCTAVPLSGTTAICAITGLTAGAKQYSAAYGGDVGNAPSTSNSVTVNVRPLFTVTPTASAGGSINPGTPQTVASGDARTFAVAPDPGYRVSNVSGCGGTLAGTTFTTGAIAADCTVTATFALLSTEDVRPRFTVTPSAATGGSISPDTAQSVVSGETASFYIVPDAGYGVSNVSGCGGTLSGTTYSTVAITADCTVTATFAALNENVEVVAKSEGGGGALGWPMLLVGLLGVVVRRLFPMLVCMLMLGRAEAEELRWYVGGAFGRAKGEQGRADVAADLQRRGFTADAINIGDVDRDAYRLFAGCRFRPSWAVEAGYTDLGDVSTSARASVPAGQAEAYARALVASLPIAPSGFEASVSYRYSFNDAFAVAARAGAWHWENKQRSYYGDQRLRASPEGTDALFGIDFAWTFHPHWSVGLAASRYRAKEDFDVLAAHAEFAW